MRILTLLHSYFKKETGGIAIMFAFFLLPFVTVTTIAIEVGRLIYAETKVAYAVDAAVIAAAKYGAAGAQQNAENIFYANFPQNFMGANVTPTVTVSQDEKTFQVSVDSTMPTIIGTYFNINSLRLNASATVVRTFVGLEVALVLDTTGSMLLNGKLEALKSAATNFVDVIYGNANTRDNTSIAVVPYIMSVNVGNDKTSWLSDPATVNDTSKFPNSEQWKGCVKNRVTGVGALTDDPPSVQPFLTYFAESTYPYHPPSQQWDNDWVLQGQSVQVINTYGYANIGPNLNCGDPISPLEPQKAKIHQSIAQLSVQMGGTDGSRIVWGWRVISPRWDGLWGGEAIKSYTASNNIKAIVMMTDGVNQVPGRPYVNAAVTGYETQSNPAVIGNNRLSTGGMYGATTSSTATTAINNAMAQACANMKAQGIEIYTIVLQVNDPATQALYQQCATSSEHYYQSNSPQELYDDFENIAKSLNRIRITM